MRWEQGSNDREAPPGVLLAGLLRGWWEAAGGPNGGARPTQQALASRLGIDQTTLSRYLNRKHPSTAPQRVVEALHAQLRAPQEELAQARSWCRAALEEQSRQRAVDSGPAGPVSAATENVDSPAAGVSGPAAPADGAGIPAGSASVSGAHGSGGPGRFRPRWPMAVTVALVAVAFAAGALTQRHWKPDAPAMASEKAAAGATPSAGAALDWPVLKRKRSEDQHMWGRTLQHLLRKENYELEVDGIFGDRTYRAVVDFQQRNRLRPDGKVGSRTWPALVEDLTLGSRGFAVVAAQELLDNADQGGTEVTGTFTPTNAAEVSFFQQHHGLRPTGRVDTDTWLALLVFQKKPQNTPAYQRSASPSVRTSP
ncbi:peptidoglycan-binding protein [Streptomyces sp. NPDC048428]|uniref:peptidoglycan-binding protein n=1 Tax=Streptomyces sp. NPDC048428 TaxID=3154503 RepID=UPI003416A5CC